MSKRIGSKLDYLMKLTHTSNSTLGKALGFDGSHISRIRSGERGMPRRSPFLEPAAAFFAKSLQDPFQRSSAQSVLCPGREWPEDTAEAARLIGEWLGADPEEETDELTALLSALPLASERPEPSAKERQAMLRQWEALLEQAPSGVPYTYGNQGKREAVEAFLADLCRLGEPVTLLLYSDESMDWLEEDAAFARRWAMLLMRLLQTGSKIRIIHTISRDLSEMLEALGKWMPVYMAGDIQPYYCTKIRDGIFRRSLFLAEGRCGLISTSVGEETEGMLNLRVEDPEAVQALEQEFRNFQKLCRPLMKIYSPQEADQTLQELQRLAASASELIWSGDVPAWFTLQEDTAQSLFARSGNDRAAEAAREARERFARRMAEGLPVTEVLSLPTAAEVNRGKVVLPLGGTPEQVLCYRPEEFARHLRAVIETLEREDSYQVILTRNIPAHVVLQAAADEEVIVFSAVAPAETFCIREPRMVQAVWELLRRAEKRPKKEKTLRDLKRLLEKIEQKRKK